MRLSIFLLILPVVICTAGTKDMQTVKRNILELNHSDRYDAVNDFRTGGRNKSSDETVRQYIETQLPDGSWNDLNYQDTGRSLWDPGAHASRLTAMATAYCDKASAFYRKKTVSSQIHRGMKYFFDGKFVCTNWWYNQIGVPKTLGMLFLLIENELSKWEYNEAIKYMSNAKFGMTGQNSAWLAENVLVRAILQKDEKLFLEARDYILKELTVSQNGEGIRPDMSFHQHGPQQQFGNYGLSYATSQSYWARVFRGTAYALSQEQIDVIRNYLLGGLQWTCWKGYMDVGSCGRQFTPNAQSSKAKGLGTALSHMIVADPERADEYRKALERNVLASTPDNDLTGYRFFNYSDYGIYRTKSWGAGLKMSSVRTIGAEIINYENLLGRYLGDGSLFIYRDGDEYSDIFPVWEWSLLPGVTCCYTDSMFPGVIMSKYYRNNDDFIGGISGERTGISTIIANDTGIYAKKSYFFTEKAVVCIGSDIRSDEKYEITTSIEQKRRKGDIYTRQTAEGQAIYHDGMAYHILGKALLNTKSGNATGSWQLVAQVLSPETVEKDVFGLWINHGVKPQNASYAYMIFPDIGKDNWTADIETSGISILEQSEKTHAIAAENLIQAVFFAPSSLRISTDNVLAAGTPCIIMLENLGSKHKLSVAEPTQKLSGITLELNGRYSGKYCSYNSSTMQTVIAIPTGDAKGETISFEISKE
ncbi:MAG: polysaccharide lyase beta-sandwich domain-containing protein [Tannerella sp.]|jgi:chondroitin AC lyase|nr:polysaccharide lyase beta-sandwich domain-containing protein [Tannerella sp.]